MAAALSLPSAGCAAKDSQVVSTAEVAEARLGHSMPVDATRLVAASGGKPEEALSKLVQAHLMTVGPLRAPTTDKDAILLVADLPTPGYALRARISPRPDDYCFLVLEAVQLGEGGQMSPVAQAPWWVIDSLESVFREMRSLSRPRRAPIAPERFERLRGQAEDAARRGVDLPMGMDRFLRSSRPIMASGEMSYWVPAADGTSGLQRSDH